MSEGGELVGLVVGGCRVERLLGRGGMGSVYLARTQAGGAVVVKVLAPEVAENPTLRARFEREGLALQKLPAHPNVVRVHQVGGGEQPFIIMELVEGGSLEEALRRQGRLAPPVAVGVARDVARGLAVIHAQGLVHRDVKPANILLGAAGAKLVDLGLAKDVFMTGLTAPGQLMGTVSYMAPEQWGDKPLDARCDVFALGATLYHLLTGRPPFLGEDVAEIADQALGGDYPPPRSLAPGVPEDVELAVVQMLMPDPGDRYPSAEVLAEDLDGVLAGRPAGVPALVEPEGRRHPLLLARRVTVGSGAGCDVVLGDPSVSKRHARIARKEKGYVLNPLKGSAVSVGGAPAKAGVVLSDGDRLLLGAVELVFEDPRTRKREVAYLADVRREPGARPLVDLLLAAGDPRTVLARLELLALDPIRVRAAGHAVGPQLGPQGLAELEQRVSAEAEAKASWAAAGLPALTKVTTARDLADWLTWWDSFRATAPAQVVPARPVPEAWLLGELPTGVIEHPLADTGAVLIGRDRRCQLEVADPKVSRLHLVVLRLGTRWVFVDRRSRSGTLLNDQAATAGWLNPGDRLRLGGVVLELRVAEPAPRLTSAGHVVVDQEVFDALVSMGHPSTCAGLVEVLGRVRDGAWLEEVSQGEPGLQAPLAALVRERAHRALQHLRALLGADGGTDPQAWRGLLAARSLPPQVVPEGWSRGVR